MENISFKQTVESNGVTINATFEAIITEERIIKELERAGFKTSKENIEKFSKALTVCIVSVNEDKLMELFAGADDEDDIFESTLDDREYDDDELEKEDEKEDGD